MAMVLEMEMEVAMAMAVLVEVALGRDAPRETSLARFTGTRAGAESGVKEMICARRRACVGEWALHAARGICGTRT